MDKRLHGLDLVNVQSLWLRGIPYMSRIMDYEDGRTVKQLSSISRLKLLEQLLEEERHDLETKEDSVTECQVGNYRCGSRMLDVTSHLRAPKYGKAFHSREDIDVRDEYLVDQSLDDDTYEAISRAGCVRMRPAQILSVYRTLVRPKDSVITLEEDGYQSDDIRKRKPRLVGIETNPGPKRQKSKGNRRGNTKGSGQGKGFDWRALLAKIASVGATGLGTYMGGPLGGLLATMGQEAIAGITGSGDYEVKTNSLVKGDIKSDTPPMFGISSSSQSSNRVVRMQHREFLGDITGSTAFSVTEFPLNIGLAQTFPWVAGPGAYFEYYRLLGCVFEFKSTSASALNSTNTALGSVIMSTQYNPYRADFTSKYQMTSNEFTVSCKPSESAIHPIECDPQMNPLGMYLIRTGTVPSGEDLRFFDYGNFSIATSGMQAAAVIGELWVSYDVELIKPMLLDSGPGGNQQYHISNASPAVTDYFGPVQTTAYGNMPMTITSTTTGYDTINFPAYVSSGFFFVQFIWFGSSTACTAPTQTLTNLTTTLTGAALGKTYFKGHTTNVNNAMSSTTGATVILNTIYQVSATGAKIVLSGGTLPTSGQYIDVTVIEVTDSMLYAAI